MAKMRCSTALPVDSHNITLPASKITSLSLALYISASSSEPLILHDMKAYILFDDVHQRAKPLLDHVFQLAVLSFQVLLNFLRETGIVAVQQLLG